MFDWLKKKVKQYRMEHPKEIKPRREMISPLEYKEDEDAAPYYAKVLKERDHSKGTWNTLRVGVFGRIKGKQDKKIGEYIRNYHCLYQTFCPFKLGDQWYALYSKDYTATRVMTLPGCEDLCGEDRSTWGFCPAEYYVPQIAMYPTKPNGKRDYKNPQYKYCSFGFMCGCVWGDDTFWKIQYLDLSKLGEKKIVREEKFGYIELPYHLSLPQAIENIEVDDEDGSLVDVDIALQLSFRIEGDKLICFGKEHIKGEAE